MREIEIKKIISRRNFDFIRVFHEISRSQLVLIHYRRLLMNRQNSSRLLCRSLEILRRFAAQYPFCSSSMKSNFVQYLIKNLFAKILFNSLVPTTSFAAISTRHFSHQQLITSKDRNKLTADRVDRKNVEF